MPRSKVKKTVEEGAETAGTIVPFTTPALKNARVRKDARGRLEIALGNFSGEAGTYVFPWASLPELVSLTVHDQELHREVMRVGAVDPAAIRLAAMTLARSGLAGPDVSANANRILADDHEAQAANLAALRLRAIAVMPPAMVAASADYGVDADVLNERLIEFSQMTYALGVPWLQPEGRLRKLIRRLEMFETSIGDWSKRHLGAAAEQAAFCAQAAARVLKLAHEMIETIDQEISRPGDVLRDWSNKAPLIDALTGRLARIVDGWHPLVELWLDARAVDEQVDALASIMPGLPIVPDGPSLPATAQPVAVDAQEASPRRGSGGHQMLNVGEPEPDQVKQVEALRAKAL